MRFREKKNSSHRYSYDPWYFYVDYRALIDCMVKDKFPIPVVEELLDELHSARLFSMLDLKSAYHQVQVHKDDIAGGTP